MFRVIKGNKIKQTRGERSLREIASASNGAFSDVSLYEWEKESYRPSEQKIPALLAALNCQFEDISDPFEVKLN